MTGPLSLLKILDFTTLLPGPFATMTLADLGANVLRVESSNRPDLVRLMPTGDGDVSAWHAVLNRNKRSLALDLKRPEAREIILRLVSPEVGYDIVVEQFRPGVMDRLGLGYEALRSANPGLIYCAITGYGRTGPLRDRAGHDNNYLALSGIMSYSGRRQGGPPPLGVQLADVGGGSFGALVGLLAAVVYRQQTGQGQMVDVSMLDMMIAWQAHLVSRYLVGGEAPEPEGMDLNGGRVYDYYETKDGRWLSVGGIEPKFWEGFCRAIGRPDLFAPGLSPEPGVIAMVKEEVRRALAAKTLAEWSTVFAALDVCVEPVLTASEMLTQPQTAAREMVVAVPRPGDETQNQIASPYRFSETAAAYRHIGVGLGAHTDEALAEAGYSPQEAAALRAAGVCG